MSQILWRTYKLCLFVISLWILNQLNTITFIFDKVDNNFYTSLNGKVFDDGNDRSQKDYIVLYYNCLRVQSFLRMIQWLEDLDDHWLEDHFMEMTRRIQRLRIQSERRTFLRHFCILWAQCLSKHKFGQIFGETRQIWIFYRHWVLSKRFLWMMW